MSKNEIVDATGTQRRGFLKCMLWAGTGVLWTVSGGVPRSGLIGGLYVAHEFGHAYSASDLAVLGTFADVVSFAVS